MALNLGARRVAKLSSIRIPWLQYQSFSRFIQQAYPKLLLIMSDSDMQDNETYDDELSDTEILPAVPWPTLEVHAWFPFVGKIWKTVDLTVLEKSEVATRGFWTSILTTAFPSADDKYQVIPQGAIDKGYGDYLVVVYPE